MNQPNPTVAARLDACATPTGVFAAAAMDQRGSLRKGLQRAGLADASDADLIAFKAAVVEALGPHASAVLLDPPYGLDAAACRGPDAGLILAYEKSGYDATRPGRQPDLLDGWSVQRLAEAGADGVKLLVYYDPTAPAAVNDPKRAFVERVGAECAAEGLPFFLEPVMYDQASEDPLTVARRKPRYVRDTMREFSRARYRVSVLKVEIPVEARFTAGLSWTPDAVAYDRAEAKAHIRAAADAAHVPFIYLSAGVDMDVFLEMLALAGEAGAGFHGVLCGRATWKGGMAAYASGGTDALQAWLATRGVENIHRLNDVVAAHARPWREGMRP